MISLLDISGSFLFSHENLFLNGLSDKEVCFRMVEGLDIKLSIKEARDLEKEIKSIKNLKFSYEELSFLKKLLNSKYYEKLEDFTLDQKKLKISIKHNSATIYIVGSYFQTILWIPVLQRVLSKYLKVPQIEDYSSDNKYYDNLHDSFGDIEEHINFVSKYDLIGSNNLLVSKTLGLRVFKSLEPFVYKIYDAENIFPKLRKSHVNMLDYDFVNLDYLSDFLSGNFYMKGIPEVKKSEEDSFSKLGTILIFKYKGISDISQLVSLENPSIQYTKKGKSN